MNFRAGKFAIIIWLAKGNNYARAQFYLAQNKDQLCVLVNRIMNLEHRKTCLFVDSLRDFQHLKIDPVAWS
jgi:hypothetical protein